MHRRAYRMQHNLLRIVRSLGGGLWPCFAAFAGGPEFVVTPLIESHKVDSLF